MLAITRELLLERLLGLGAVTELYALHDPAYVSEAIEWLAATERALAQLRNPLAGLAATERGRVLAGRDGLVEATVTGEKVTPRRAERVAAASALARMESALRDAVATADATLTPLKEQMAQLVAHASSVRPIPIQGSTPREEWLNGVWRDLAIDGDKSRQLHAYLAARLAAVDRLYLLGEILDNALAGAEERTVARPPRRAAAVG